jgi:Ni,Fe-hydrogenase I cytochrome b subunit
MSDEHEQLAYNPLMIKAWSILSVVVAGVLFMGFVLCNHLLNAGGIVWAVIRWIFSPII